VILISPSAIRAVDLYHSLKSEFTEVSIAKLFAKHIKIEEQIHFLHNTITPICVGTPNRIRKLAECGALTINNCELLLIDTHRDDKKATIFDINDTKDDLLRFYKFYCDEHIQKLGMKLAFF